MNHGILDIITSGFLYLIVYGLTILLTHQAELSDKKGKKRKAIFLITIAILLPCFFAAVRDTSVGTDTSGYPLSLTNTALSCNSFNALLIKDRTYTEVGYQFFIYFITRFTNNFQVVLFFTEVLILLPFVCGVYLIRKNVSMTRCMSLFMFCYFHLSLNIMRQSIAMSLIFLAFILFAYKSKKIVPLILIVTAYLFHKFSFFIVILLILFWLFKRWYNTKKKMMIFIAIMGVGLLSFNLVINNILLKFFTGSYYKFSKYISGEQGVGIGEIITSPSFILFLALFLVGFYLNSRYRNKRDDNNNMMQLISLFCTMCYFLQAFITFANRITWFLVPNYYLFISYSFGSKGVLKKRDKNIIFYTLIILFWLFNCMLSGSSSTSIFKFA